MLFQYINLNLKFRDYSIINISMQSKPSLYKPPQKTLDIIKKNITNRVNVPLLQKVQKSFVDYYERLKHQIQQQSVQMIKWLQEWKIKCVFTNYGLTIKKEIVEDMASVINNCNTLPFTSWQAINNAMEELDKFECEQIKKDKNAQKNLTFSQIPGLQIRQLQNHIKQLKIKRYQFPSQQFTSLKSKTTSAKKNGHEKNVKQEKSFIYFKIIQLVEKLNFNQNAVFWKCAIANDEYKLAEVRYQNWVRPGITVLCTDYQQFKDTINGKKLIRCYQVKESQSQLLILDSQQEVEDEQMTEEKIDEIKNKQIQISDKYSAGEVKPQNLENKYYCFEVSKCEQVDKYYQCVLTNKKNQVKMHGFLPMAAFICNKAIIYMVNPSFIYFKGQYRLEMGKQTEMYEGFNKLFHYIGKQFRQIGQIGIGDRRFNLKAKIKNITNSASKSTRKLCTIQDRTGLITAYVNIPNNCQNGDQIQMFNCAMIRNNQTNLSKQKFLIILQHSGKMLKASM